MAEPRPDPTRIPLVGTYNSRLFSGAAGSSASIIGIGIIGSMIIGAAPATSARDQRFSNILPDKVIDKITGATKYYCYKRPGFSTNTTPASGSIGTALKIWTGSNNEIISAFGGTNSTIYSGTSSLGTLTGVATDITETFIGTTANLVIPTDGNKAYYYPAGGAMTEITDADFPGKAGKTITGTFVHMNGYAYIMCTDGTIWNSDLNSISAWTSTSFISANTYPDKGIGLARYKNLILAFGKETIEFFTDVGNASGSPLQKIQEATIRIGCLNQYSMCALEDNIAWVASSDTGTFSVYILDGYAPKRISTNAIDAFIAQSGLTPYLTSCKLNGKTFIFVTLDDTVSYVYCLEDDIWHEWKPASGSSILWHKMTASSAASSAIYAISRTGTGGKVYIMSQTVPVYTDDTNQYEAVIYTSKIDVGTEQRKFLSRLTLVAETTSTTIDVSWSDDDYATFSTARTIDLSANRKYLTNCGNFRRRAFKLSNTSGSAFRLEALELEFSKGIH